jgi:hypothetical protein
LNAPQTKPASLGQAIAKILLTAEPNGPTIGQIIQQIGEKGFGLLFLILALPSALPIPAPGYSTPFGIMIALLAVQMLIGRKQIWLPKRLCRIRLKPSLAQSMLGAVNRFLHYIERFIRPRQQWIRSRPGLAGLAVVILIMAALMILPIPLTNTAPAMVIFLIGVGLCEEDGLLTIAAFALGILAVALYAYVIYLFVTQGPEAIESLKEWVKMQFGMHSASE